MSDPHLRRRMPIGEVIAFAALIVSALGVWIAWQSSKNDQPTRVVEQHQAIPLTLRSKAQDEGRELVISPVEPSHALESINIALKNFYPIGLDGEGVLKASEVESKLAGKDLDKGDHSLRVGLTIRYVEMGKEREANGNYVLRYRVEGGGLLGGRSVRLESLSRA